MQAQTTFRRVKTLGPFLTLILLSSPTRDAATSQVPLSSAQAPSSCHSNFVTPQEAFGDRRIAPRPPLRLGLILTLILTLGQRQSEDLIELAVRV